MVDFGHIVGMFALVDVHSLIILTLGQIGKKRMT